jgi:predicted house-cleaning NTP pyrophosphatase (Maf/HAM1 superfamily)
MKLILASGSPLRSKILIESGIVGFQSIPSDLKPHRISSPKPSLLACVTAKDQFPPRSATIVLSSARVLVCHSDLLCKPLTANGGNHVAMARNYFRLYSHYPLESHAAVYAYNMLTGEKFVNSTKAVVSFTPFSEDELCEILNDPCTYQAFGALPIGFANSKASNILEAHVDKVEGDFTGFMALPVELAKSALRKVGYDFGHLAAAAA